MAVDDTRSSVHDRLYHARLDHDWLLYAGLHHTWLLHGWMHHALIFGWCFHFNGLNK